MDLQERNKLLREGTIDCIWCCFTMDGREEEYQLAGPYLYTRRVFVVKKDSDIRELSDLVGKTIALQAGSIAGVRILVVEDNELNMEIAEYMFTERGAVVEKAADGKKALEMFAASEEGYYDVIMMDIMMPEMDGLEATRRIRRMDRKNAETVPIFAMSANAFDDDVARSRAAGMNEHLSKPLSFEKAAAVIAQYVRKNEE